MAQTFIQFHQVSKAFGATTVVDALDLSIGKGEFISMLGPSGSGKTTLLMLLAGFERPSRGTISLAGKRIDTLAPHQRNMGVVFQNYALFPHLSVLDNVAFPLKMRGIARSEIAARVTRALDMVQLGAFHERRPSQLSGGQQQRVALARALVFEPAVVLMDEPLGALDKKLREQMQLDIRALHHRLGLTIVFVTHDQTEALTMSDRIAIFNHGKIEQIGTPADIYDRPKTRFVSEFIGEANLISGQAQSFANGLLTIRLASGNTIQAAASRAAAIGQEVTVSIRPEWINLGPSPTAGHNTCKARVSDIVYHGDHLRIQLDTEKQNLIVKTTRQDTTPLIGQETMAWFAPEQCWIVT